MPDAGTGLAVAVSALVNFGCGPVQPDGWVNIDRDAQWGAPRSFDEAHLDHGDAALIVANHALQMTGWHDQQALMDDLVVHLAPGGVLRVLVPDAVAAVHAYDRGDGGWFPVDDQVEASAGGKLTAYLTWYSEARVCFTPEALVGLMGRSGLDRLEVVGRGYTGPAAVSRHPAGCDLDSRHAESLIVEGQR